MKTRRQQDSNNLSRALRKLACLIRSKEWNTIALYGAGKHTTRLLNMLSARHQKTPFKVVCILDDNGNSDKHINGIPVILPSQLKANMAQALVISSDAFEEQMYQRASIFKSGIPVIRLYGKEPYSSNPEINRLLASIINLPSDWHKAGTMQAPVLEAMVRLTGDKTISRTLETGAGKTTLLLSNISRKHSVFAVDVGNSITAVRASPLFRADHVEWIEGPTQLTLPKYNFTEPVDFALIDGPHGYPFPEMEYYYIYQHLAPAAILAVDDIHIPTISNLFKFLKEDAMFELVEVVATTAFFRRTAQPAFDPTGDGWWLQNYNRKKFPIKDHPYMRELLGR